MNNQLKIKFPTKMLQQKSSGKTILILYWLYVNQNKINQINCFIPKMMYDLGFDCKGSQSTKISQEFILILNGLVENNILQKQLNDITYSHNRYGTYAFVRKKNKTYLDSLTSNFVICEQKEINTLLKARKNNIINVSLENLVTVYFYIKSCINNAPRIKIAYPNIDRICHFTGIGKEGVQNALKNLQDIGLLHKYQVTNYYSSSCVKKYDKSIYSLENYNYSEVKAEFFKQMKLFDN